MSEMQQAGSPIYNLGTGQAVNNIPNVNAMPNQPVAQQNTSAAPQNYITNPIYQYPTTSLYNPAQNGSGQSTSGVNIYIYNPSGIGTQPQVSMSAPQTPAPAAAQSISSPGLSTEAPKTGNLNNNKTKKIVELTDDYIKTLENYLRSADANVRKNGIKELVQRYEEDDSRYDHPALTALLNIALQDSDANNRILAMSPVASGTAHGDNNTALLLQNLQQSDKLYGQEAKMASDALLGTTKNKIEVIDNSPNKENVSDKSDESSQ